MMDRKRAVSEITEFLYHAKRTGALERILTEMDLTDDRFEEALKVLGLRAKFKSKVLAEGLKKGEKDRIVLSGATIDVPEDVGVLDERPENGPFCQPVYYRNTGSVSAWYAEHYKDEREPPTESIYCPDKPEAVRRAIEMAEKNDIPLVKSRF